MLRFIAYLRITKRKIGISKRISKTIICREIEITIIGARIKKIVRF